MNYVQIILTTMFLLSLPACKCQNEIDNWKWGNKKIYKACPVKQFPIPVWPTRNAEEKKAGAKIDPLILAAVKDVRTGYKKDFNREMFVLNKTGIPIMRAPKNHPNWKKICRYQVNLYDGSGTQMFAHRFMWTDWAGTIGDWKLTTYICLEKYKNALKLMKTPAATRVKRLRLKGLLRRQFVHYLIGPNTPQWHRQLTADNFTITALSAQTKELIQQTVINRCAITTK